MVNVALEEAEAWARAEATTFFEDPHAEAMDHRVAAWRQDWDAERTWGVRDRGRWVASLATLERTLTVPGAGISTLDLAADAVTAVTVSATHRRRGLLTRMITESLSAAVARGDAVSILVAAEWPIYGRFGYAPAVTGANYRFRPRAAGRGILGDATTVRQVDREELARLAPAITDAARRLRPGQVDRRHPWWPRTLGVEPYSAPAAGQSNWFVHEGPDGPDGLLGWKSTRNFELTGPKAAVQVEGPLAATEEAYLDLWAYLAGVDAVEQIDLVLRPVDEPIRWFLGDGRALEHTQWVDFVWLRVLDIPAALSARRYAVPGRVVLEVGDPHGGGPAAGRYALAVDEGGEVTCEATTARADLGIPQRTLASVYLGGHRLRQLGRAAGVQEHTPGTASLVDLMFSTPLPPWNATGF